MESNIKPFPDHEARVFSWVADRADGRSEETPRMTIAEMRKRVAAGEFVDPMIILNADELVRPESLAEPRAQ